MTFDPMSVEVTCVTLPKDHCVQVPWQYPGQYINVCGYSDQFGKLPHIYTYYIQNEWSHSLLLNSVQARQKSDPFIYQPTWFWSKFWQSYLSPPPFFKFIVFCYSNFLRFKLILAQTSEKIEKSTHSYTKFCIDMGSLIYWYTRRSYPCWWHILVAGLLYWVQ